VSNGPIAGIEGLTAADICARFDANKQALALLREGMAPGEFVQALIAKRQYVNGIDFMAHVLPAREGVWWGCLCVEHVCGANLTEPDRAALLAAASWVLWPTEANRAAAQAPAEAAGRASPAGTLAMAANVVGAAGPVPLSPAKAVANAVKLATTKGDPARIADTQRLFVELGMGVAEGRFTWPSG